jgi:hypothetical protein
MVKKKPTAKRAAKKAAPAKKLIDGKYSHKFLTRYRPDEGKNLEELKKHFGQKTYMGTIIEVLDRYLRLTHDYANTQKNLMEARQQMNKQASLLFSLKDNFKKLQELKLIDVHFNDNEEEEEEDL